VTVVLWASAFVGIRSAGRSLAPGPLTLGRLLIGAAVLGLVALARREHLPGRAELRQVWPGLVATGVLWFGAYSVALNAAERRVDAGTAAMLVNVGPILIAVLAGLFLGEGFPRTLLLGLAIAFAGVVAIGLATSTSEASTAGVVLCVAAAMSYAAAVTAQKPVLRLLSPLQTILLSCSIGAVVCLPFAPQLLDEVAAADASAIAWMAYLGIFPTALAFTTWAYALARTDAGRLGATTYLVPPISVLLGWSLLSETPPVPALAGGALCLLGVIVSRR
jgi:drug/metabolite transporter (DMT)-like permease